MEKIWRSQLTDSQAMVELRWANPISLRYCSTFAGFRSQKASSAFLAAVRLLDLESPSLVIIEGKIKEAWVSKMDPVRSWILILLTKCAKVLKALLRIP